MEKRKAEKIISRGKEDRICLCQVSDVHQNSLRSEAQLCFVLTIICSEVKHRYEYTRTPNLNVRPQGCQAREHRCRQLLQLVAVERQIAVAKQKAGKIISTRKQDNKHHRQVSGQLVLTYVFVSEAGCC